MKGSQRDCEVNDFFLYLKCQVFGTENLTLK
jgi:hypothetical protein